jgi:hypothetical protein
VSNNNSLKSTTQVVVVKPGEAPPNLSSLTEADLPPKADVCKALRSYGEPSTFFGESDMQRFHRLIF